jgi:DNA ligase D-like protein (predicted 3'-phosphoesterase)
MPDHDPIFTIQKHDAKTLHYDFRIEVRGVLKSWALPKGPSIDPAQKRLAIPTSDHDIDYATFEGYIPEGQYGSGPVLVWDIGTYRNITEKEGAPVPIDAALTAGHAVLWLEGKKIKGGYVLQRDGDGGHPRWLLIKAQDNEADPRRDPVISQPYSVLSGRSLREIMQEEGPD